MSDEYTEFHAAFDAVSGDVLNMQAARDMFRHGWKAGRVFEASQQAQQIKALTEALTAANQALFYAQAEIGRLRAKTEDVLGVLVLFGQDMNSAVKEAAAAAAAAALAAAAAAEPPRGESEPIYSDQEISDILTGVLTVPRSTVERAERQQAARHQHPLRGESDMADHNFYYLWDDTDEVTQQFCGTGCGMTRAQHPDPPDPPSHQQASAPPSADLEAQG